MKHLIPLTLFLALCCGLQAQSNIPLPEPTFNMQMPLHKALQLRQTERQFTPEMMSLEQLSTVLWMTYGYNRPDMKKRTAPSARNVQETDVYVFLPEAVYLYNADSNMLIFVAEGDHRREISGQPHFAEAPVALVLVANYERMKGFDEKSIEFYSAVDCGYVSQNIYLGCTAMEMGTVACGAIDRDAIAKILRLKNARALLAHPVGFVAR